MATFLEIFNRDYIDPTALVHITEKVELPSLDFATFVLELLCEEEDIDVTLLELLSDVKTTHYDLRGIDVRDLLLNQLLMQLSRDSCFEQVDLEKLCLTDYPKDAFLMVQRLLEAGAPLRQATFVHCRIAQKEFILLEAARAIGKQEEILKLDLAQRNIADTKLSVLHGLRRCGWWKVAVAPLRLLDADVTRAIAWWKEEVQNWNGHIEDQVYPEAHCCNIIDRYEQRLAFFQKWELAMQSEACVLARILACSPCDRTSTGCFPVLVAHRVAAFVVREPEMVMEGIDQYETNVAIDEASPVIEDIEHDEEAAFIDPHEAYQITSETSMTWLQMNAEARVFGSEMEDHNANSDSERIFLLTMSRNPSMLQDSLQNGSELEEARNLMKEEGCDSLLPSGASVFVAPYCYQSVLDFIRKKHVHLKCYNVVVSETLLPFVKEILQKLPSKEGVRIRGSQTIAYAGGGNDDCNEFYEVTNTFLVRASTLRCATSVVQSTTEAHDGINPRRHV